MAYIIVSNMRVEEVEIVKNERDFYIVGSRFRQTGIRVRKSRVFTTRRDAEKHLPYKKRVEVAKAGGYASPYDYEW